MNYQKKSKLLATGIATALTASLAIAFFSAPQQERTEKVKRQFAPSAMTFSFGDERTVIATAEPVVVTAPIEKAKTRDSLYREADGKVTIDADRTTNNTGMVRAERGGDLFPQGRSLSAAEKSAAFLERHGGVFGISSVADELRTIGMKDDQYGNARVTYQQMHGDVPVLGAVLHSHISEDGRLTAVNGRFIPDVELPTTPTFDPNLAAQTAVAAVSKQLPNGVTRSDLNIASTSVLVYRENLTKGTSGANHLAYQIEVTHGNAVREFVYVDAVSGNVVDQITGIHSVKQREVYAASYQGDNSPTLVYEDGNLILGNRPAGNTLSHEDEVAGAGESYNFFFNLSDGSHRSYDGNDAIMRTVDTDPTIVCPNANWNGTSTNYCLGTSSDDVVTHEWGHAYTQYTSGLIYAWQSGALNESYSDIFGETVDLINNRELRANDPRRVATGGNDGPRLAGCSAWGSNNELGDQSYRWLMGEDAYVFGALPPVGDGAIRDMWTPSCFGDADYVNSPNYHCAAGDAGGVHSNSSINNRAYALLVDGNSNLTNSTGPAAPVAGIGLTKAAHIFWRANSHYNFASANFNDNANSLEMACMDLVGVDLNKLVTDAENGTGMNPGHEGENDDTIDPTPELSGVVITESDCDQVTNAIAAVEMRFDVTLMCGFEPMFDPAPAPMCGEDDPSTTMVDESVKTQIHREDWDGGLNGWTTGQAGVSKNPLDTVPWAIQNGTFMENGKQKSVPDDADGMVYGNVIYQENRRDLGNCTTDDESGQLWIDSPAIPITGTETNLFLTISQYVNTELGYDGGNLKLSINGGNFAVVPAAAFVYNGYNGALTSTANQNTNPKAGEPAWQGGNEGETQSDWGQTQLDLTAVGVTPGDSIRLRFDFGQDGCNGNDGWYVDEVELFSCPGGIVEPPPPPPESCEGGIVFEADIPPTGSPFTTGVASSTTVEVSGMQDQITEIYDINVRNLNGQHTWLSDVIIDLTPPDGEVPVRAPSGLVTVGGQGSINLFDGSASNCGDVDWLNSIDIGFDDEAANPISCSSFSSGGSYQPADALSAFDGEDANGTWTLTVHDGELLIDGQVNGWALEFCPEPTINPENTRPVANDDMVNVDQDTITLIDVVANDEDDDNEPPAAANDGLTIVMVTDATRGETSIDNDENKILYSPDEGYCNDGNPVDTFQYTIDDGSGAANSQSEPATVSITINCEDPGEIADEAKGKGEFDSIDTDVDDGDSDSDSDSDRIKFHFDPKRKKDGELKGHLHLTDKDADVKIHMKDITYLGPVIGNDCDAIDNGSGTFVVQFEGVGTFDHDDVKTENVKFRACAVDDDELDAKKDNETTKKGGEMDRFSLECIVNCPIPYDTDDRVTDDDTLDKGDVRIKKSAD